MRWLYIARLRLRSLLRRDQVEDDLADEVRDHLDRRTEELIARGIAPRDARDAALRAFGGVEQRKEEARDARGVGWIEDLGRDLRYAMRMLRRNPGFSTVAIVSLALGIGANTVIFTAIDTVMLRKLPVPDAAALVSLRWTAPAYPEAFVQSLRGGRYPNDGGTDVFSFATFEQLRAITEAFTTVVACAGNGQSVTIGFEQRVEPGSAMGVSGNYFAGLGVPAMLGRTLLPADDREGAMPVAVASHAFWQGMLAGNPAVVGQQIVMNGRPITIVGVAPPSFFGLEPGLSPNLWIPLSVFAQETSQTNISRVGEPRAVPVPLLQDEKTWWLRVVGRVSPGTTPAAARAAAQVIFDRSIRRAEHPSTTTAPRIEVFSLERGIDTLQQSFSGSLWLLMGIVGLVLLIACANLAGLLLERAKAREREIAVRLSLGVSRARLVRQLLTESLALAFLGGLAGLIVASWSYPILMSLLSSGSLPPHLAFALDANILGFAAGVSTLAGVIFGLAPALRASRVNLVGGLTQRTPTAGGRGRGVTVGTLLVGAQVATSVVLLVTAGLFLRTLQELHGTDLGFDRTNLLLFDVAPGSNGYADSRLAAYYAELQNRVSAVPGVVSVTLARRPAVGGGTGRSSGRILGTTPPDTSVDFYRHEVGPHYFTTLGIRLTAGRAIDDRDTTTGPRVLVVNDTLAHRFFGQDNPVGHRIDFGTVTHPQAYEIIGVVRDAKYGSIRAAIPPTVYLSYQQAFDPPNSMTFIARTGAERAPIVAAMRSEAQGLDGSVPLTNMRSQLEVIDRTLAMERTFAVLSTCFGVLALLLACVGLYGTMAYTVTRRTNEIGIRMALGATRGGMLGLVLKDSLLIVAAGLAVGIPATFGTARLIGSRLFGVTPTDPLTIAAAVVVMAGVASLAALLPALRASRVDPMVALRCD